ncbi:hypothetical protein N9H19_00280 [Flavobacteriales bacterium]|mgnify:FL=1|jgi:hypothetical protein|nr:hypothetical protein [Flavobacteriales bacterium]|tara:strand:- start:339 stop:668 length:330 start_codon:yes stop_codon:yes gene_type:complete
MFSGFTSKETSTKSLDELNEFFYFLGVLESENNYQKKFKKPHTFYNQTTTVGLHTNSESKTRINFYYSFSPNFLSWILGICFFPFGLLIFIIPNKDKDEFELMINTHEF